ncbi:MAG TPA: phospholipid carrier-dependent glycosyltransferase [Thermoanaerobaculia bacterium]
MTDPGTTARRASAAAVALVIVLATVLRFPMARWPLAEHPGALCCGHPDETIHADLVSAFRSGSEPGIYPPGLAFLTTLVLESPAGSFASRLVPAGAAEDQRDRVRAIATARILASIFSAAAVVLLFLLCLEVGLAPWLAASSAPLLALAPLYAVQSTFALADVPDVALLLGSIYAFLRWARRRMLPPEIFFGFLLGGAFATKLIGVAIGVPPMISMIVRSGTRRRTSAAIGVSFLAGTLAFSGGHLRFASAAAIFQKVVIENVRTARIRPGWNAVHYVLSLVPGMGVLFVLLLVVSAAGWSIARFRAGGHRRPSRMLDPLPAVAAGCLVYFPGICFSSNPFTRHLLPLDPFLILFALVAVDRVLAGRATSRLRPTAYALLFVGAVAYNVLASWPLLRSFTRDPVDEAAAWVRAQTGYEPLVPPMRNFPPVPSVRTRTGSSADPDELFIVHSAWLGRLTGSWWLKPAPADLSDVYHFEGTAGELRFWQNVAKGAGGQWRVIRAFGDDWKTPERLFLSAIGRGYDQFVTAGRAYVVVRAH